MVSSWIVCESLAGMQAQALGLAEAAGLAPEFYPIAPRSRWKWLPVSAWRSPLAALPGAVRHGARPDVAIGCGGTGDAVAAALRAGGARAVAIQNPRMNLRRFDLVVANRHDRLAGPNVVVVRTAMHRVTSDRLAEAADLWAPRLAHLPRPLVAVLVGGSNGRFRLDGAVGAELGRRLAEMMQADRVGLALTPSRRTDPAATRALTDALAPHGGWVWDGTGDNPYFGLLALADAIVVTQDSVSMLSEAVATTAPVLVARLPGRGRRHAAFLDGLIADRRVRLYAGRLEHWPVTPLNDTPLAAAEMRRRLGF
jgi:mitochondrial fission protein ELM1